MNSICVRVVYIVILILLSPGSLIAQTYEEEYNLGFQVVNKTLFC